MLTLVARLDTEPVLFTDHPQIASLLDLLQLHLHGFTILLLDDLHKLRSPSLCITLNSWLHLPEV
jgi:hypothetical protein